jgi:hypothetical protein
MNENIRRYINNIFTLDSEIKKSVAEDVLSIGRLEKLY